MSSLQFMCVVYVRCRSGFRLVEAVRYLKALR